MKQLITWKPKPHSHHYHGLMAAHPSHFHDVLRGCFPFSNFKTSSACWHLLGWFGLPYFNQFHDLDCHQSHFKGERCWTCMHGELSWIWLGDSNVTTLFFFHSHSHVNLKKYAHNYFKWDLIKSHKTLFKIFTFKYCWDEYAVINV